MAATSSSNQSDDIMRHVSFSEVSSVMENIRNAKTANKQEIWRKYVAKFEKCHKKENQPYSFFPFIRLFLPKIDRERESYGIQIATMGHIYISAFQFNERSGEAKALTTPMGYSSSTSDYADVVYKVIEGRCPKTCSLSVAEMNDYLDKIANPQTKRREVESIFAKISKSTTAIDQKWMIRIILKKLNLGIAERKILSSYHPKAYLLYERMTFLTKVCDMVDSGKADEAMDEADVVSLFQPLRPMLCEQARLDRLPSMFREQNFYVELKMDGERFQIHKQNDTYRYFSRNADFTDKFGPKATGSTFSASLDRKFDVSVKSVILDGEMLVYDQAEKRFLAKGDDQDARNLKTNHDRLQVYCAFDLLFLNGESLITRPYEERIRLLNKIINVDQYVVVVCERKRVESVEDVLKFFNEAIDRNEEGIIIKGQDSVYCPGVRNSSGWYKLKPDYVQGLVSDLDLLVMGGTRSAKGFMEKFIVGVAIKEVDEALGDPEENITLYAVGSVAQGLNREQFNTLTRELEKYAKNTNCWPKYLDFGNSRPSWWIEPKHSRILQVIATELHKSTTYRTEYTLRFPRITAIRSDKPWYDCCLLTQYEDLIKDAKGTSSNIQKLAKRHATLSDVSTVKRGTAAKVRKLQTTSEFEWDDEIARVDDVCVGKEFCILSTRRGLTSIRELGNIIKRHGGVVVKNPGPTTFLCVAGDSTAMVMGYAKTQLYDIVNIEWVVGMLGTGEALKEFPPLKPFNMIAVKEETKERFKTEFDAYNDSYVHDIRDNQELKMLLDSMSYEVHEKLLERELIEFEEENFAEGIEGASAFHVNLFSSLKGFFVGDQAEHIQVIFRARRGIIVDTIEEASHVFVVGGKGAVNWEVTENCSEEVKVMDCEFIIESIRKGRMVDVSPFCIIPN